MIIIIIEYKFKKLKIIITYYEFINWCILQNQHKLSYIYIYLVNLGCWSQIKSNKKYYFLTKILINQILIIHILLHVLIYFYFDSLFGIKILFISTYKHYPACIIVVIYTYQNKCVFIYVCIWIIMMSLIKFTLFMIVKIHMINTKINLYKIW